MSPVFMIGTQRSGSNLLRLMSIVLALYWWDIDLAHGYVHTILGLMVFLVGGLALTVSSSVIAFLSIKTLQLLLKGKLIPPAPPV